ncbi:MAG: hypothetical protein KAS64_03750 [Spirochaetes bacterium]|nr:hypothetical protein [Spirochaetota bacterium]
MTEDKSGAIKKRNWIIVFSGIICFFLGFFVLAQVGRSYHGFFGFLAPFLLILGLVVIAAGLITPNRDE